MRFVKTRGSVDSRSQSRLEIVQPFISLKLYPASSFSAPSKTPIYMSKLLDCVSQINRYWSVCLSFPLLSSFLNFLLSSPSFFPLPSPCLPFFSQLSFLFYFRTVFRCSSLCLIAPHHCQICFVFPGMLLVVSRSSI